MLEGIEIDFLKQTPIKILVGVKIKNPNFQSLKIWVLPYFFDRKIITFF